MSTNSQTAKYILLQFLSRPNIVYKALMDRRTTASLKINCNMKTVAKIPKKRPSQKGRTILRLCSKQQVFLFT